MDLMKVAPVANASALKDPRVWRCVMNTSLAISPNEARDVRFAVFPIILKKTMSSGVTNSAIAAEEATDAMSTLMNRFF